MILANRLFKEFPIYDKAFSDIDELIWDGWRAARTYNKVKLDESESAYDYHIELAGVRKKDIEVTLRDGGVYVTIKKEGDENVYSFNMPEDVDPSKVKATYVDGMLKVKLEKLEKVKPVKIKIL